LPAGKGLFELKSSRTRFRIYKSDCPLFFQQDDRGLIQFKAPINEFRKRLDDKPIRERAEIKNKEAATILCL